MGAEMIVERSWFDRDGDLNKGIWSAMAGIGKELKDKGLRPVNVADAQENRQPYEGVTTYCLKIEGEKGKSDVPFWAWFLERNMKFATGFAAAA